jgi:putative membrane protein
VAGLRSVERHVPALCLGTFLGIWALLALAPRHRADWLLENLPTFVAVPAAIAAYRVRPLSDRAYVQATIFLVLHTIGSHYTYSEVPLGDWLREMASLSRNHYDRIVHLAFGLLLLRPMRELGFPDPAVPGRIAVLYFSVTAIACWSAIYEVTEWLIASLADPAAGIAYLGTQGDVWDAQKDMALALLGASLAAIIEWRLDAPAGMAHAV